MKKYFAKELARYNYSGNLAFLSNKFTGEWIKIPKEIMDILLYSYSKKMSTYESYELIEGNDNKEYLESVYYFLDKMGLLAPVPAYKRDLKYIPLVTISITNNCNLSCSYCCTKSSNKKQYLDLILKDIKKAIDFAIRLNPEGLKISGGEPMLRKDFFEILAYARENYSGKIILATNATLITLNNIDKLTSQIDSIEISLDSYDNKTFSLVRGCTNKKYDDIKEIINELKQRGLNNIHASIVVGKNNAMYLHKFRAECENMGVKPVVRNFMSTGDINVDKLYLNNMNEFEYNGCSTEGTTKEAMVCNAGVNQIFIDYDGKIYPCPLLNDEIFMISSLDDINENIIDSILNNSYHILKVIDQIRPNNNLRCRQCDEAPFCQNCIYKITQMLENEEVFNFNCKNANKMNIEERL